jgi:hypothetical protein
MGYALESLTFPPALPERIHVDRGSKARRYFECVDDFSLVFLRISV